MTAIADGPHYEIHSTELAKWIDAQGADNWWTVDGDRLLSGNISFPAPTRILTDELRRLNRPLLVQAPEDRAEAKGQEIMADEIDSIVSQFKEILFSSGPLPGWAEDRFLYLRWKDKPTDWMLSEDTPVANLHREATTLSGQ